MNESPYNGKTALVKKMEVLLQEKKLSTPSAVRLMLEKDISDIKENHDRDLLLKEIMLRQDELERRSTGMWVYKNPRKALVLSFILYSFTISDIRQPVMLWVSEFVGLILKAL